MFRQIDVGAAEAGGLPDVVEPKVDIRTYDIVSLEGRVPLESQKKREAHGHENLEATAVREIVQAPEHPESDRYEEEHRGDVVAVFEDELQGDYGPLHEVIQDEEQDSEREQGIFPGLQDGEKKDRGRSPQLRQRWSRDRKSSARFRYHEETSIWKE